MSVLRLGPHKLIPLCVFFIAGLAMAFTFITVLSIREEEVRDCKKLTQLQNQIRCEQERQRDLQAKALKLKQINFTKDPAEVNR
jgi:uncharacterized membrane protein (DUF106 family)